MPAAVSIYYISPQSLPLLSKDFTENNLYFSINILISEEITPEIMKDISSEEGVMDRLASFG